MSIMKKVTDTIKRIFHKEREYDNIEDVPGYAGEETDENKGK